MSELGDVLKKARYEKGYSLDDIQELTKIRKRYLEALEAGDYEVLPGKFYIRAFIKNYAECVGLDANEVLKYYHDDIPATEVDSQEVIPARKPQRMRSASSERLSKTLFTILMWGFLILILVVVWYYLINKESAEPKQIDQVPITENSAPPEATPQPTPEPTTEPLEEEPVTEPVVVQFMEKSGKDELFSVSPKQESYTLVISASGGDSWLEVYDGGKKGTRLYYATMKDGESKSFTISQDAYINMGRPGYITATIEDTLIEDGDNIKNPKRIWVKPIVE